MRCLLNLVALMTRSFRSLVLMKIKRRYLNFVVLSFFCLFIYAYIQFTYDREEKVFFYENYILFGGSSTSQGECRLPLDADPFDESVSQLIKQLPDKIICSNEDVADELSFIDEDGVLRIKSETTANLKCFYQLFEKSNESDDVVFYHDKQKINTLEGVSMGNNHFVEVECRDESTEELYQKTHFYLPVEKKVTISQESSRESPETDRHLNDQEVVKPSVLILVIESLSRINFLRFMKKTKESLENLNDVVYLKGLTKIADNSFPNMVPFLTGKRAYVGELPNETGPYDDWPFVWKRFKERGYKTALIEDFPAFTLFNYEAKGFRNAPTDWYPHPFWIHLFNKVPKMMINLIPFEISNCFDGRVPKIDIFLGQINYFASRCHNNSQPYFLFSFYIEVTHNDFNKAQTIDSHVAKFIDSLKSQMKDTIFILMGDHGMRFGPLVQTVVGRIEERMPLLAIRVPEVLKKRHPHLLKNLESNSDKLVTWLDLHQLFLDVIQQNYTQMKTESIRTFYSPWRQLIPSTRTCADSLIPDNYCVCDDRRQLNLTDSLVVNASLALISHVNLMLPLSKCHILTLNKIINAELILPNGSTAKPKGFEQKIEITVSASPSDAVFRALLYRNVRSPNWQVKGEINRINQYANQSQCVHNHSLKLLCYCL